MAVVAVSLFMTAGLVSCGGENDNAENAVYEAEIGGGGDGIKGNGNNGNGSEGNGSEGNGDDSNKGTHETVDLGLPSGIRWATCNVGASAPHETGCYFAWGETDPKATYDWDTYKWCKGSENTLTKYCNNFSYGSDGFADNKVFLDAEDDVAIANWGGGYRMPTYGEFMELSEKCTWTWETSNGVRGYTVTGTNGNSIFLRPLATATEAVSTATGRGAAYGQLRSGRAMPAVRTTSISAVTSAACVVTMVVISDFLYAPLRNHRMYTPI